MPTTMQNYMNPFRMITMQDIRLVAGEGKLRNTDVLAAVNVIIRQREDFVKVATPSVAKTPALDIDALRTKLFDIARSIRAAKQDLVVIRVENSENIDFPQLTTDAMRMFTSGTKKPVVFTILDTVPDAFYETSIWPSISNNDRVVIIVPSTNLEITKNKWPYQRDYTL